MGTTCSSRKGSRLPPHCAVTLPTKFSPIPGTDRCSTAMSNSPPAKSSALGRTVNRWNSSPAACAIPSISPSTGTANSSPSTPTWNAMSAPPGTCRRASSTSSPGRTSAGDAAPGGFPPGMRTRFRASWTSVCRRPPRSSSATEPRCHRATAKHSSSATGPTVASSRCICSRRGHLSWHAGILCLEAVRST